MEYRVDPMSDHKGHDIGKNSAHGKDFMVCRTCCIEVYDDSNEIKWDPSKVRIVSWDNKD